MKKEAFRQCLSLKQGKGRCFVLNHLDFPEIKTKLAVSLLDAFQAVGRTLFVDVEPKHETLMAVRNLASASVLPVNSCSPLDLFESDNLFLTKAAVELFQKRYAESRGGDHE